METSAQYILPPPRWNPTRPPSPRPQSGGKQTFGLEQWKAALDTVQVHKADLNRLVMNFLVTEGYVEAAKKFREEAGADPGVDLDGITDRMEIRKAV